MNLFPGEMLDKSLHFYLLTPVRREVLLAGKYLAGLIATTLIFTTSTALQVLILLAQFDHPVRWVNSASDRNFCRRREFKLQTGMKGSD